MTGETDAPRNGAEPHRLHPLTVLVELVRALGQIAWAFVLFVVVGYLGGRQADPAPVLMVLAGSTAFVALARYLTLRYWVEEGRLVIRSGVVSQQVRTIPLEKIQNIELRQSPIHQIAGVVDFRIETAAGPEAEAHLAVLGRHAAERLRARLLAGRAEDRSDRPGEPRPEVIWAARLRDLLVLGATSNRAGAILGAIAGLIAFVGRELPRHLGTLQRGLAGIVGAVSPVIALGIAVAAMLVLGWLLSISLTVVSFHGFRLTREPDGRLRRRYGLLSRFETVIAPARIQLLRVEASWLRRRLGFWEVAAHTAGSAFEGQGATSALLCPLLRDTEIGGFCRRLLGGLDLGSVAWRPVSRVTIRRGFVRFVLSGLVPLAAVSFFLGAGAWLVLPAVVVLAWLLARRRHRILGHAREAGHLLSRAGLLRRRVTVVPEGKVQWVGVTQSPPQRRYGIATVTVATASGAARIVDVDLAEALTLQQTLCAAASAAGAWLPDAV